MSLIENLFSVEESDSKRRNVSCLENRIELEDIFSKLSNQMLHCENAEIQHNLRNSCFWLQLVIYQIKHGGKRQFR